MRTNLDDLNRMHNEAACSHVGGKAWLNFAVKMLDVFPELYDTAKRMNEEAAELRADNVRLRAAVDDERERLFLQLEGMEPNADMIVGMSSEIKGALAGGRSAESGARLGWVPMIHAAKLASNAKLTCRPGAKRKGGQVQRNVMRQEDTMRQTVYTVHAYRWGDREGHSYTVGVFSVQNAALESAKKEEDYRGGKYECEVLKLPLDANVAVGSDLSTWIVKALPKKTYNAQAQVPERSGGHLQRPAGRE
jgi:hypothetical protein